MLSSLSSFLLLPNVTLSLFNNLTPQILHVLHRILHLSRALSMLFLSFSLSSFITLTRNPQVFSSKQPDVSTDTRMDNFVYRMSPTSIGLCRQTFMRWIEEFPVEIFGNLVQDLICLLACSRHGLQEDEILELISHRDPRTFEGSGLDYPEVPLPRLMYVQCFDRIELFVRGGPRWSIRIVQFAFSVSCEMF